MKKILFFTLAITAVLRAHAVTVSAHPYTVSYNNAPGRELKVARGPVPASDVRWAYKRFNLEAAREAGLDGSGVNLMVIDSGLNCNAELDCSPSSITSYNSAYDVKGHGTEVIKIIKQDGKMKGVAPKAKLISFAVPYAGGLLSVSEINKGLDFAIQTNNTATKAEDKIHVINISFGATGAYDKDMAEKIRTLVAQGTIIVAPSGNTPRMLDVDFPAYMPEVISVGGLTAVNWISMTSSYHPQKNLVDFLAPNEEVFFYNPGTNEYYTPGTGTSLAAPFVAGLAALAIQSYKNSTGVYPSAEQVKSTLRTAATRLNGVPEQMQGAGIIDAKKLIAAK